MNYQSIKIQQTTRRKNNASTTIFKRNQTRMYVAKMGIDVNLFKNFVDTIDRQKDKDGDL